MMHLVSYRTQKQWRAGIMKDPHVVDLAALNPDSSVSTVRALLEAGPLALSQTLVRAKRAFQDSGQLISLETIELGPPVPNPDKIICLGLNYPDHATEFNLTTPSSAPPIFAKFRNSLCGPSSPIILPQISTQVDYEGELAVVIGRRCKDVEESQALACVAGYTIINDVSARDLQMQTSQWTAGKILDTFAPMGPGIVPAADIPDPQTLQITTRLNGITLQQGSTSEMIFSVSRTISFLSSLMTLEPGDLIATGTPSGVGFRRQPPVFLKAGDVVEVEISGIGLIRNPVVRADTK